MQHIPYNDPIADKLDVLQNSLVSLLAHTIAAQVDVILRTDKLTIEGKRDSIMEMFERTTLDAERMRVQVGLMLESRLDFLHLLESDYLSVATCLTPQFLRDVIASEVLTLEQKVGAILACLDRREDGKE